MTRKDRRHYYYLTKVGLYGAFLVLSVLTVIAAFSEEADAWPILILAGLLLMAPNFDRLLAFKASTSGFEAELEAVKQEAEDITDDARKLLETLKKAATESSMLSLELVQRAGWLGEFEDGKKQQILAQATERLREIGLPNAEIEDVLDRCWHRYVRHEFALSILGNQIPDFAHPLPYDKKHQEQAAKYRWSIDGEWRSLRGRWPNEPPTPEEVSSFLEKVGDDSPERRALLDCYRHYRIHKKHSNIEAYSKRHQIPAIRIKNVPAFQ